MTTDQGNAEVFTHALATAEHLRERVAQWQTLHHVTTESVEETLRSLREGRDNDVDRLR